MKIRKSITINRPVDSVWKIIAEDFDKAHLWMGPIPHSYATTETSEVKGAPMHGRICHLSDNPDGAKAREVITEFDAERKRIAFEISPINVPAVVPVKRNFVEMSARAIDAQTTEVTWLSQPKLKPFAYLLYPILRAGIPVAFAKLLAGLKDYAEKQPMNAS